MNAILFPLFDFVAKNKWLQWTLLIVTGLVVIRIWMHFHDENVRKLQKKEQEVESLKEQARVSETRHHIEETRNNDIEQARDAARALPRYGSLEQLRDENPRLYAELFGNRPN